MLEQIGMNKLPLAKRAQILNCFVEGMTMRTASRLVDVSINTVTKLLVDVGTACAAYQDQALRNLPCKRVQCDEIWALGYSKQKNVPEDVRGVFGKRDVYTWTAICADTKLVPCWHVGRRDAGAANLFMADLAGRLAHRVQLTTDGHKPYLNAVEVAFSAGIDHAMLVALYGADADGQGAVKKYSPGQCCGVITGTVTGAPDPKHVFTSYVERANLTMGMGMGMRRCTRVTNAFSKKVENHMQAVSLHFMYYNFGRIHKSLRVPPAMEAGVSDHVWSLEEIAALAN